ncbi:hypothetical protein FSP39_014925 [Pinctada imbricata]|uniref:Uncharacterized protein n=1 Tax=Pinctada imbricata TaxID=66713 RepID=A0AA88YT59_PINIB|nr:hypothetical protein FSP39_014925 [Pinctada imbricata]
MNEDDRKILQRNRTYIIKNIHNIDDVNSQLFEHEVFSEGMRDEVEAEGTKEKRIRKLLDIVPRRGPTAFRSFIQVLVDTDNSHVADTLYPNASSVFTRNSHVHPHNSTFQPAQEELPTSIWKLYFLVEYQECESKCLVTFTFQTYKMSRSPRGRVLIINNKIFYGPKGKSEDGKTRVLPIRDGTDADKERLSELFRQLHFTVEVKEERKAEQMLADIVEEIYKPDHKDADCFILVIMTHGCREGVYGVDGEVLSIDKVKDLINGNNFLVMAGKPKLVFIQACRGEQYDEGVTMTQDATAEIQRSMQRIRLGSTVPDSNQETKEPTGAHILIAMATTLDMVSFRNKIYGSWFLQAVVYVFQKFAFQDDLFKLMIKVSTFRLKIGHRCVTMAGLNLKV